MLIKLQNDMLLKSCCSIAYILTLSQKEHLSAHMVSGAPVCGWLCKVSQQQDWQEQVKHEDDILRFISLNAKRFLN